MTALELTLVTLPYEIVDHVCEFLDKSSLKQCRLVSHSLEAPASAALFSTIHITTTIASLNHAKVIGRLANLATKVRTITYHASTLIFSPNGSLDEPTGDVDISRPSNLPEFKEFLETTRETKKWHGLLPYNLDAMKLWQDYNALWQARRDLESRGYVSQRLRTLLDSFPNITTFRLIPVTPEATYVPGEHIPFLSRIDEDAFTDVLSACYDREYVRCLTARSLHWGSFRPCSDMRLLCVNLRELHLAIDDGHIGFPYEYMREDFTAFLELCRNLEVFTLGINTNISVRKSHRDSIRAACDSVLTMVWSRLERVKLTNFITSEIKVKSFLINHSANLRLVKLECLHVLLPVDTIWSTTAIEVSKEFFATLRTCQSACHQLQSVRVDGNCWQISPNTEDADEEHPIWVSSLLYTG